MFKLIRRVGDFLNPPAVRVIRRALKCKSLADLIAVQSVVCVQYRNANRALPGKYTTVIEYMRNRLKTELIAPRVDVAFFPVPTIDRRELPKYALYIFINNRWCDTELLVVAGEENSTPVIVHKSQHFDMLPLAAVNYTQDKPEQVAMSLP